MIGIDVAFTPVCVMPYAKALTVKPILRMKLRIKMPIDFRTQLSLFMLFHADAHMSEYVSEADSDIEFLTGFTVVKSVFSFQKQDA